MLNWVSTSNDSRKPEIGKPVFIRGTGRWETVAFALAVVWDRQVLDLLGWSCNWEPHAYSTCEQSLWNFDEVTHWAEIPEGLFNEPAA